VKKLAFVCLLLLGSVLLFSPNPVFSKQVVPFGLCPKYNPRIMYQLYQPFIEYLNESTPYQFEIRLSKTYQETIEQFGRTDGVIALCGPVPYIKAKEKYNVKPIARALSKDGKPFYRGIILVRDESSIHSLADLKGKSFAFGEAWSTAGHIVPLYDLAQAKVRVQDLKHHAFLRHHDSVAHAILKGEYDAGAVKDVVALKYEREGLRFVHRSGPIPTVPIVVRHDAPKEMIKSVQKALFRLNPMDPNDQKKMALWDEEVQQGFTDVSDSDYDSIRRILKAIPLNQGMKEKIRD
jgi:phosphonate transport system substrate-binding protein